MCGGFIGKVFGLDRPDIPSITMPAPAVNTPEADPAQKVAEGDLAENRKKRRGKASLIIDRNSTSTGTDGSGLNI